MSSSDISTSDITDVIGSPPTVEPINISSMSRKQRFSEKMGNVKDKFQGLDTSEMMIILGISISGMATVINFYDSVSGFSEKQNKCKEDDTYKKAATIRFAVILVISILILAFGIYWLQKKNSNKVISLGILTTGLFGILFAITTRVSTIRNTVKTYGSLGVLALFLAVGVFGKNKSNQ